MKTILLFAMVLVLLVGLLPAALAKESVDQNGVYNCASSREQAERAVGLIGDHCRLVETDTSDHPIHTVHSDVYIEAVNSLLGGETGK